VDRAVITHGHADHARPGHGSVLATAETLMIMAIRYGANFAGSTQSAELGEVIALGDTKVSLHPAGHVLGSAQVLGRAWRPQAGGLWRLQAPCRPHGHRL
jgi:putative mRNA 3-end processing factor